MKVKQYCRICNEVFDNNRLKYCSNCKGKLIKTNSSETNMVRTRNCLIFFESRLMGDN